MKFLSSAFLLTGSCTGFVPSKTTSFIVSSNGAVKSTRLYENKVPFFASEESPSTPAPAEPEESTTEGLTIDYNAMTEEEEVESLVEEEMAKTVKVSKLKTRSGVDYAPWMNVSSEDEAKVRQLMKEKAAARRRRELEEKSVSGNLYLDSQAQELSGTGLNYKIIDGMVELEWATKTEKGTAGFRVKRRAAKTEDFNLIASYEDCGPLCSKGPDGGIYRYLDETVSPGGWVYRISEVDGNGGEADLCQCLLEVQTEQEQKAALIAGVGAGVALLGLVIAASVLDPYGGM